ncbi:host specificity protein J [Escherichia coli O45:H2 str. 2010C-4211]|nr:host specificity protein J [Escherichia coli O45:H2 str. 2010C-4211]
MATTNAFCLASPPLARICLHGDLTTIWPPPQPVCEHGSGSHPCAVDADAGIPPSDERRLVPDTYSR